MVLGRRIAAGAAALFLLAGCAGHLPVPGGTDAVNASFYTTQDDLLSRLGNINTGMAEDDVLAALGRKKEELSLLRRDEILTALMGTTNVELRDGLQSRVQSLTGYRLDYKAVGRKHGFTSPIRIRTDEKGFNYTVILVFRNDRLFTEPLLSGGVVDNMSSRTFFDFINPGTVIDHTSR